MPFVGPARPSDHLVLDGPHGLFNIVGNLPTNILIYRVGEFIRMTHTGRIDLKRSKQLVHQLVVAASVSDAENILLDLRGSTVAGEVTTSDLIELATEFNRYRSTFKGRIANLIPADEKRISVAQQLRMLLEMDSERYAIFTSFEEAIDWLSDIRGR